MLLYTPVCSLGSSSSSSNTKSISEHAGSSSRSHPTVRRDRSSKRLPRPHNLVEDCHECERLQGLASAESLDGIMDYGKIHLHLANGKEKRATTAKRKNLPRHWTSQNRFSSWHTLALLSLLLILLLPACVLGSAGDRSQEYQKCVEDCKLDSCFVDKLWDDGTAHATKLPLMLRLTGWNCIDDCKYHCTHRVTNEAYDRVVKIRQETIHLVESEAKKEGWSTSEQRKKIEELVNLRLAVLRPVQKQMVQFHGKWVFIRFLGAQEPLSVLFSLLNFLIHFRALSSLRRQVPDAFPLKLVYVVHTLLSCNSWFLSAVFHTRDKNFTEKLDYFAAGSVILGGWFIAICRLLRLSPYTRAFNLLLKGCGIAFVLHVIYLSIGRFDYSYNMKVNIFFGLSQSTLWLLYSFRPHWFSRLSVKVDQYNPTRLRNLPASPTISSPTIHSNDGSPPVPVSMTKSAPPSSSRKAKRQLRKIILLLFLATCLEIFDLPPIGRSLDAHALWHAATFPLASLWYQWIIEDARECTLSGYWIGEGLRFQKSGTVENLSKAASNLVGTQVVQAYEKTIKGSIAAKKWVETVAGKSSNAIKDATGSSSAIEFKALTNKLNEVATGTLSTLDPSKISSQDSHTTTRNRTQSISTTLASGDTEFEVYTSEREKLHGRRTMV